MLNKIETLINSYFPSLDEPGCSVLVVDGSDTVTCSRGIANMETGEEITSNTNFRLASVSKQFTAACVLQLRDAGHLSLTQPVSEYLTSLSAYGRDLCLEHLLRHTSGVKDYEKLIPSDHFDPLSDSDVMNLLAAETETDFIPGSQFRYSNSGYALLAMVVEAVSGLSFPDYLRQNIFDPLGMADTVAFVNGNGSRAPAHRAIGYFMNAEGDFVWADQNVTTAVLGDGGIYCSAADYAKWIQGYSAGKVLDPETVKKAWLPGSTVSGTQVPYGYGWRLELRGDQWRPYHPGSTSGFRTGVLVDSVRKRAVLVLLNRCNGDAVTLARAIEDMVDSEG